MLRIGKGKPCLIQAENRWGVTVDWWYVSDYFWLCPCEWRKMSYFQSDPEKNFKWMTDLKLDPKPYYEAQLKTNPNGSSIWEFDALAPNKRDWVRYYIVFGSPTLVQWTWTDTFIRKPALKAIARFLNTPYLRWVGKAIYCVLGAI